MSVGLSKNRKNGGWDLRKKKAQDREVTYYFQFRNRRKGKTKVWLSKLPTNHAQTATLLQRNRDPLSVNNTGGNTIEYYELESGEKLKLRYRVKIHSSPSSHQTVSLTSEERERYLRSTSFITINQEIKDVALNICKGLNTDREKAYAIFQYVYRQFSYRVRVKKRGSIHFLKTKKGDCGEFSALYAALCRSIGIPCRMLFGTFAVDVFQPHAWNEVFLEDKGWIPVDASMANVQRKQIWRFFFSNIRTLKPSHYFGNTEGQRVIFSVDTEHPCIPRYPDTVSHHSGKMREFTMVFGEERLVWGKELLKDKKIPYYQPMYLYSSSERFAPKGEDYLGNWKVVERGKSRLFLILKKTAAWLTIFFMVWSMITESTLFSVLYAVSVPFYGWMSALRGERTLVFSSIALFFLAIDLFVLFVYLNVN